MISLGGSRLSEQPIHSRSGVCSFTSRKKNPGSLAMVSAAHRRLAEKQSSSRATTADLSHGHRSVDERVERFSAAGGTVAPSSVPPHHDKPGAVTADHRRDLDPGHA